MSTTLNHLHKLLPERKNILRSKSFYPAILPVGFLSNLTLNLLTTTIVAPPSNDNKWQMGFNSAFKGLMSKYAYGKKNRISLVIANRLPIVKYELTILSL